MISTRIIRAARTIRRHPAPHDERWRFHPCSMSVRPLRRGRSGGYLSVHGWKLSPSNNKEKENAQTLCD
jgi:hypothetical protein